jgi:hypothetical protein
VEHLLCLLVKDGLMCIAFQAVAVAVAGLERRQQIMVAVAVEALAVVM